MRSLMALIWAAVVISGCSRGHEPAAAVETWQLESLLSQQGQDEVVTEIVEVSHCGVPEPQRVECPAGTIEGLTYALAAPGYIQASIGPAVANSLNIGPENGQRLELELPPPGSFYRYEVSRLYRTVRGEMVARSSQGREAQGSYTFLERCSLSIQSRQQLYCATDKPVEASGTGPGTPDIPPTALPLPGTVPAAGPTLRPPPPSPTLQRPTATPVQLGQNCSIEPDRSFAGLWSEYRQILGCSTAEKTIVPTLAEESFQGGHLFWRSDTDEVYIILDRQKNGRDLSTGTWQRALPGWKWDGSDPAGVGLSPPAGLVEPERGFGWLWRTHLGREDGPLGWALDREYGFDNTGQAQTFEHGLMFQGSSARVYVLMNDGQFFTE